MCYDSNWSLSTSHFLNGTYQGKSVEHQGMYHGISSICTMHLPTPLHLFVYLITQDRRKLKGTYSLTAPTIKVLIITCYHTIFLTIGVASMSAVVQFSSESAIISYFLCESTGTRPGKTCDISDEANITIVNITWFLVLLLSPAVNLIYVINFGVVKQAIVHMSKCGK